ncbi:MAG TPA: hypothetical protein VIJ07_17310, partial [Dermatophilaceae bacterium]
PGLALGEPSVDGLAVDLGGPLPVRAMELGRVAVAAAVRFAAAVVPLGWRAVPQMRARSPCRGW